MIAEGGSLSFHRQGFADIEADSPITQDTVFCLGSITKTLTGVAVMQLWEEGSIDLAWRGAFGLSGSRRPLPARADMFHAKAILTGIGRCRVWPTGDVDTTLRCSSSI